MSHRPVVSRWDENRDITLVFIADFNSVDEKSKILKNYKKLFESENLKGVFVKLNETAKERKEGKALTDSLKLMR